MEELVIEEFKTFQNNIINSKKRADILLSQKLFNANYLEEKEKKVKKEKFDKYSEKVKINALKNKQLIIDKSEEPLIIFNDHEIIDIYHETYKNQFIKSGDELRFIYNSCFGTWVNAQAKPEVSKRIIYDNLYDLKVVNEDGKNILQGIVKNNSIGSGIFNKPVLFENFHERFTKSNLKKLCFRDGYYDFTQKKFLEYPNIWDIVSPFKLSDFKDIPRIQKDIDEVYDRILNPMFDYKKDKLKLFLTVLARGLAGEVGDKVWICVVSLRNAGKSILASLLRKTINEYYYHLSGDNLISKNNNYYNDNGLMLKWILPMQNARIAVSTELTSKKECKLDGNMLKMIASGCDPLVARNLFQSLQTVEIQSRLVLFCNGLPSVTDSSAYETMMRFDLDIKFVSQKEIDDNPNETFLRLKDDSILDLTREKRIENAFLHILLESYEDVKPELPKEMAENQQSYVEDDDDSLKIKNAFIFTKNENDKLSMVEINEILNNLSLKMRDTEAKKLLELYGCKRKVRNYGNENKPTKVMTNVKIK